MSIQPRRTFAILVSALVLAGASLSVRAYAAEGRFERTLKVTGPVDLDVRTGSGDISVRPGGSASVLITGRIRASGRLDEQSAQRQVQAIEANPPIEQVGNVIKIGEFKDPEMARHVSISYEITTPANTQLRSSTGSGDQSIEGLSGQVKSSSGSGDLKVSNIGDFVRASTGSGDIRVDTAKSGVHASTGSGNIAITQAAGKLQASTGSGNVTIEQSGPGDVDVNAASGQVRVSGVDGSLHVQTASGNVSVQGKGSGSWKLESASGNVDIQLPPDQGFSLRARTVSGDIHTAREITVQGSLGKHHIEGKVGDGALPLEVSTVSGNIRID
jgi:DUF4097 and DUF4098 domain-containing protein YvlB